MSTTISTAFVAEYAAGVKLAYQRMGSKLRNMVRLKTDVLGSTETFQKLGKGSATAKARHGDVVPMNAEHTVVKATLEDWYAPEYIDKLDEYKINFDEKQAMQKTGAYALGRKCDGLIITAMTQGSDFTTHTAYSAAVGMTKTQVMTAFETLNNGDVPDDGERYNAVGAHQWNELMNLTEFKSADYVGGQYPWLSGTDAKRWLNMLWIMHTGLPQTGNQRSVLMWHKSAIGLAEGASIHSQIDWVPTKAAHLADSWMSMGAISIDKTGIILTYCDDTATTTLA